MANAKHDNNQIPVAIGLLNTDGSTPTMIKANPSTNIMQVDDATTGSDLTGDDALRDDNRHTVLLATSSTDGSTPVPLYVNSSGQLLIDST